MRFRQARLALPVLLSLVIFLASLAVLRLELRAISWHELTQDVLAVPRQRLLLALVLTAINYVVLTGYDLLAFRYAGKALPALRVMGAAFVAYAISHSIGFAALSGATVRYRFYARWGVTGEELSRVVFSYSTTFWLGLLTLGGLSLVATTLPDWAPLGGTVARLVGILLMAVVAAYLAVAATRQAPLRLRAVSLPMPSLSLACRQLVLSIVDWLLAGSVLYLLLPSPAPPFLTFTGLFLVAILLGMISHVPGGLGVFEGTMVILLRPWIDAAGLVPAFVVYRVIYYLLPFLLALVALLADEVQLRRQEVARAATWLGSASRAVAPRALAALTFLSGAVLLVSGATPAASGRLRLLEAMLPLGVIEMSHFVGSVAGAGLLVLSQGLARRLDAAYAVSVLLVTVGAMASVLKGGDVEEATWLLVVLLLLIRARPAFDRRARLFETRFSPEWIAAVVGTMCASVWIGMFAFKHVDYTSQLWWRFELSAEASRFLRASVGAAIVLLLFGFSRLLAHAPAVLPEVADADLTDAARIVAAQPSTSANLVFLRDKALLFDVDRTAFVMYGVQGRSWIALGDPVGETAQWPTLLRLFLERVDDFGGWPVFYQVRADGLHRYVDLGLTFVKLGEEAYVDLRTLSTEGAAGARFRQALRRLQREGCTFRVLEAAEVAARLAELRRVSDDWLARKRTAEKGFSLGFFDETYVRHFPVAVIERQGAITTFANLWSGEPREELSVDLMRFGADSPRDAMEALLAHVMLWGRDAGYRRFSLGMAPLSGVMPSPVASVWQRAGAFLYTHGEPLYGFQGLRGFKEKFHPTWEPRYLAYAGGHNLARVLADVSALIAGGYRQIFMK